MVISMQNHELTADQARDLRALAGMIIPPSTVYDVPGADDEKIFGDILRNLERDRDDIRRALSHLAAIGGCAFDDLAGRRRGHPVRPLCRMDADAAIVTADTTFNRTAWPAVA